MAEVQGPYVVVHHIGHVRDALAMSQKLGRPVTLISPPGAVASMGPGVFRQMITNVTGDIPMTAVMDCGADPGQALAALRAGCKNIRLDADDDILSKLRDMAGNDGAVLDGTPLSVFDMANHKNGEDVLRVWLDNALEPVT